jgi:CheY-like chemotaxis protein
VSPEASSSLSVAPADRFAHVLARPLGSAGRCRVLLVDDSRVNVNVMKKMLARVSATWTPLLSPAHSDSSNQGGLARKVRQNDRSSVYLFQEAAIPVSIPVHEESAGVRFDYSEADDGPVAVQMVQAAAEGGAPFDVVFMDNIMILMHGPEAAQMMRAAGFRGLIVGVTGNVMAEDVQQYMASGADHVLGKPVNMDDLEQILNRLTH